VILGDLANFLARISSWSCAIVSPAKHELVLAGGERTVASLIFPRSSAAIDSCSRIDHSKDHLHQLFVELTQSNSLRCCLDICPP
jgi:hypothetical protein